MIVIHGGKARELKGTVQKLSPKNYDSSSTISMAYSIQYTAKAPTDVYLCIYQGVFQIVLLHG